jgi:hypothetical protein
LKEDDNLRLPLFGQPNQDVPKGSSTEPILTKYINALAKRSIHSIKKFFSKKFGMISTYLSEIKRHFAT